MNIEFSLSTNKDETRVYMSDQRGWFDGKRWRARRKPVCKIPGPVVIEIQRRLGIEQPKGVIPTP